MRAVPLATQRASATGAEHRHTSHEHEHEFEPQRGMPEPLPRGESILWQGAPDWRVLARECFHVRKLTVYFAALVAWRIGTVVAGGGGLVETAASAATSLGLAALALGIVTLLAWMSARTTLYTITDRRVVMRIGIVLSVTFNLPFSRIESAGVHPLPDDHGDIALSVDPKNRIAFVHLWPHLRPWHVARTEPSLRCIAHAAEVSRVLTTAWTASRGVAARVAEAEAAESDAPDALDATAVQPLAARPAPRRERSSSRLEPRRDAAHAA